MESSFPGYRVIQQLYGSPRSIVERAVRVSDGRTVVIKQSTCEVVAVEAARRVHHEHGLLRSLCGDGVVEVVEVVRDGSRIGLVIESFGESLAMQMAKGRLPLGDAMAVASELARILARIHAAGVVHKDINPQNIVYDPTSRTAKVIDFDIASRTKSMHPEFVAPTSLEGTLRYMAPEQTGRLNRSVDARSDLYSLGITLFELFTGRRPFVAEDALAIVHAHLALQPQRIDEIDPEIPGVVADIVAKLVAKTPEQRYQTAVGLQADLERCRRELAETGRVEPFGVGQHDVSSRFEFSDRLYGRDGEVRALLDAFTRTANGAVETVLVSGYSGIGKSSVVREIYAPITLRRGYVASGKFEQLHRDIPYSAVVAALDELLAQIVADPALERWRTEIAAAVADDGPLVRSVLTSIERVLGPQAAPPVLDPMTAQRRLAVALSRLVQVFARKQHPLVLFLDDMQWADAASLQLITRLATSEDTESLLVIEAYRDNEVDPVHPFAVALREHEKRGAKLSRIALAPLQLAETTELLADALRLTPEQVGEIASVIWRKTEGNPFFIRQFIRTLYEEGCITFDSETNAFAYDTCAIERVAITENVADLLARKLGKLPTATQSLLVTAAAIGNRFDVATLAIVAGRSTGEVHETLAPAVATGMIVPIAKPVATSIECLTDGVVGCPRYAFQHDRIQQAAYEVAPAGARERLHLEIGRQLLASLPPEVLDTRLFDVVHHLNRGLALITEEAERARFVELAIIAARRARRSGALDVALTLLRSACASRDWREHYAAWFEAHLELAEALQQAGFQPEARETVRLASCHATPRDRATLEALDTDLCSGLGLLVEAIACGRRGAAILGVDLPTDPAELGRQIEIEIGTIMAAIAKTPIERWIDLPAMTDPDQLATMSLLVNCIPAAYQVEPQLMVLISAKLVALSLRHGNCGASARGYLALAIVVWTMGQSDPSFQFGRLGVDVASRCGTRLDDVSVAFQFATFASPWKRPLQESIDLLRSTVTRAADAGDNSNAGYAAVFATMYRHLQGAPLGELIDEARSYRKLCEHLGLPELAAWLSWYPWHLRSWTGAPCGSNETELDPAQIERTLLAGTGSRSILTVFQLLQLEQQFWRGNISGVMEKARVVASNMACLPANFYNAEFRFYSCLAAIAVADTGGDFEANRAELARYAEGCPGNFGHMSTLVEAELARTREDLGAAMVLYDAAIDAAAEHGFIKVETIAHELTAAFWIGCGKPQFAAVHLGKARDLCEHWGARPRAAALERRRRGLGAPTSNNYATMRSTTAVTSTLDFATVVKASQAITSDIVLDSLLVKIMDIIIENTGAQTGSIILESNGELRVHASTHDGKAVRVTGGVPVATAPDVSRGIVTYVTRTAECVVLDDATRHPSFRADPYVRERRPRSVLCLPIVHKERMIGAVYLENNLVVGAFTVDRLEALGILVAQLAISIENAVMFSRLEELVTERTQALTEANEQLREQAVVRERMESQLRLAQKLESVGQLAAGIAHEINTPIQFVGDSVTFLQDGLDSLLGFIDAYRASIGAATGSVDLDKFDVDYLRENMPAACARALEGVQRVSKIVCAMMVFAHPDRQEQQPTKLNAVLENTLVMSRNEYCRIADVETDLADIPEVLCHAGEVSQVLLNLVINAAHAIEELGAKERGKISIATRVEDDMVVVSITDTGGGIPEAIRDRIFDPFFTTKDVGRGTGQGLTLARTAIVDRHGGRLDFETRLGLGTTFFVRLPIRGRTAIAIVDHSGHVARTGSPATMS